jgi:glycosyltransferase involved in cell wall biosynthesis
LIEIDNYEAMGMIQPPLFSVIITTYNRVSLLPRAINSVLNQTYHNFELIIVNGGSSDDTGKVVKSFRDSRIRYSQQTENRGMLADRNIGFDLSKGKYVALLDDDDELLPEALEVAVNEFSKLSSDGIGILWFNCMEAESRELTGRGLTKSGYISFEDDLCENVYGNFWEVISSDLIDVNTRFDERLWGGEIIFWLKFFDRTKVFYVHRVLRKNHTECSTVSTAKNELKHIPRMVLTQKVFLENYGELRRRLCPKKYGHDLVTLGFWQILNGETPEARKTLVNALRYEPALSCFLLVCSFATSENQLASLYENLTKVRTVFLRNS